MYNWYAVDTKKLAPTGWHVPTTTEWDTLQNYLMANGYNCDGTTSEDKIAKSLAAQSDWQPSTSFGAIGNDLTKNNSSDFSALPGGSCNLVGYFIYIGSIGTWWSATVFDLPNAYHRSLSFRINYLGEYYSFKNCGFSVRLVRDN